MSENAVLLFHTTSAAFRAEKLLSAEGIACRLVHTPREYSSDCGISLRLRWADRDRALERLAAEGVEIAGCHPLP